MAALASRKVIALPAGVQEPSGAPELTLGIVSDVHLDARPGDEIWLRKALVYFRDHGADGVVIAGDMANLGRIVEFRQVVDTWYEVFPDDKAPDGRHVEKLFCYGNHECIRDPRHASADGSPVWLSQDWSRHWKEIMHEDFHPVFTKNVKGYDFVLAHYPMGRKIAGEFLTRECPKLDTSKPFFFIQHEHPKDTCYGPWAGGHDDGRTTRALSAYPNAIALSGHSHYPLTDERGIWQDSFTSIGTSTLHHIAEVYALIDNAYPTGNRLGYTGWKRPSRMLPINGYREGKQGMLMRVYADHVRIERRCFRYDLPLGDDWVFPVGKAAERPYAFARVREKRVAPEFAKDARIATKVLAQTTGAFDGVEVSFPAAKPVNGCRVWKYEVQTVLVEDDSDIVIGTRQILAPGYFLPVEKEDRPGVLVIPPEDFPPKAHVRFEVRPVECFGRKGASLVSEVVATEKA